MSVINKPNGNENHYKKETETATNVAKRNFDAEMFSDNFTRVKKGGIAVCENWEQVEQILECFNENDHWQIEEFKGTFYILSNPKTRQLNRFNKFIKAIEAGEIIELDDEKEDGEE